MSGLQFFATVLAAVVAPVALWFQQRQQNARDVQLRRVEADIARAAAEDAAQSSALADQRGAYLNVLQAAHRYRAERSPWAVRAVVWCEQEPEPAFLGSLFGGPLALSASLPALQEAIGAVRLWATSAGLHAALLDLLSASDRLERTLTVAKSLATDARDDWQDFESALAAMSNAAVAALAFARGEEPPPYQQVVMGRERPA